MRVVLLKTVEGLGHRGDVRAVSVGYARNYLLPNGWARAAGPREDRQKAQDLLRADNRREKAARKNRDLIARLQGRHFTLAAKATDTGTLYAGVTAWQLSAMLKRSGFGVEPEFFRLTAPLKSIGTHRVLVVMGGQNAEIFIDLTSDTV